MGCGAMGVTKPFKFIRFGDIHGPKRSKFIGYRWAFISQTPLVPGSFWCSSRKPVFGPKPSIETHGSRNPRHKNNQNHPQNLPPQPARWFCGNFLGVGGVWGPSGSQYRSQWALPGRYRLAGHLKAVWPFFLVPRNCFIIGQLG